MDNMHPYLTMPSRAAVAGRAGSLYDHVCLPENEKDLIWAHDGRSYRSQVVIRLNNRRKTEAFLLMLADDGAWKPMVLDDGTVSGRQGGHLYPLRRSHLRQRRHLLHLGVLGAGQAAVERLP